MISPLLSSFLFSFPFSPLISSALFFSSYLSVLSLLSFSVLSFPSSPLLSSPSSPLLSSLPSLFSSLLSLPFLSLLSFLSSPVLSFSLLSCPLSSHLISSKSCRFHQPLRIRETRDVTYTIQPKYLNG